MRLMKLILNFKGYTLLLVSSVRIYMCMWMDGCMLSFIDLS